MGLANKDFILQCVKMNLCLYLIVDCHFADFDPSSRLSRENFKRFSFELGRMTPWAKILRAMINNKDEWFGKVSVDNHTEQSSKTEKNTC